MSINKNEKIFFPALKIYYSLISEISEINENADGTVSVTFEAAKDWKRLYATRESIVFSELVKQVDEGILYSQTLEFKNPGDDLQNNTTLSDIVNKDLIVKIVFINNESKIIGNLKNPVKLFSNFKYSDLQTARSIKIIGKSISPAPYIT